MTAHLQLPCVRHTGFSHRVGAPKAPRLRPFVLPHPACSPGPYGVGRCPIHSTSWKPNSEKVRLDGRGVLDLLCYCSEASCFSCSSITSPKVSSISNEKRTMPLSLPLSSKYRASSSW